MSHETLVFDSLSEQDQVLIITLFQGQTNLFVHHIRSQYTCVCKVIWGEEQKITLQAMEERLDRLQAYGFLVKRRYNGKIIYSFFWDDLSLQFLFDMAASSLWKKCLAVFQRVLLEQVRKNNVNSYFDVEMSSQEAIETYLNNLTMDACLRNDVQADMKNYDQAQAALPKGMISDLREAFENNVFFFWEHCCRCEDQEAVLKLHPYFQLRYAVIVQGYCFFRDDAYNRKPLVSVFDILSSLPPEHLRFFTNDFIEELSALAVLHGKPEWLETFSNMKNGKEHEQTMSAIRAFFEGDWKKASNGFGKIFSKWNVRIIWGTFYHFLMFWSESKSVLSASRYKDLVAALQRLIPLAEDATAVLWRYAKKHELQEFDRNGTQGTTCLNLLISSQLFAAAPKLALNMELCSQMQKAAQFLANHGLVWPAAWIAQALHTAHPSNMEYVKQWEEFSKAAHLDGAQNTSNNWDALMNSLYRIFKVDTKSKTAVQDGEQLAWILETSEHDTSGYFNIEKLTAHRLLQQRSGPKPFSVTELDFDKAVQRGGYAENESQLLAEIAPLLGYYNTELNGGALNEKIAALLSQAEYVYRYYRTRKEVKNSRLYYNYEYEEHYERITLQLQKATIFANTQENGALQLSLPEYPASGKAFMKCVRQGQYELVVLDAQMEEFRTCLHSYFNNSKMTIPAEAASKLKPLLDTIASKYTISGKLGKETLADMESIESENQFVLRIEQLPDGFSLALFVKPSSQMPLLLTPCSGKPQCTAEKEGKVVWIQRNLAQEKAQLQAFMDTFGELRQWGNGECSWSVDNLENTLQFLEHFKAAAPDFVVMEWNRKTPIKIAQCGSWKDITLHSGFTADQWFSIGAEIPIGDTSISLSSLLEAIQGASSNFVKVDEDTYLELTTGLRKQLQAMAALAQKKAKGEDVVLPPASLPLLAGIFEEDALPENLLKVILTVKKALASKPRLPQGVTADLRDYQIEGFKWMRRLADCKIGCCLADDMGIGKTLQAITLLLDIASRGPSLVVTPASLGPHWYNECARFAPSLQAILFPVASEERSKIVSEAKAFDVIICTYGVLMTEDKLLTSRHWNCLILDEAQAIKNKNARRAKVAKQLQADFRIALTGTPVENNLLELWSLFDFLNHGMLGSEEVFKQRYVDSDMSVTPALKRAVSPLILRRRKEEVLEELPEKTEIVMEVELSATERVLYEALRQKALADLQNADNAKMRFQILAQLTTLRECCCHPELAKCKFASDSAKMTALGELAQTLKESGHRTLIFSQFVGFLSLIKKMFDKQQFSYSYLDGSTPARERQQLVDEFNHGTNDFFLISLLAGGLGLNLTAADFVIILDPWWNPAVENQAADRVHRIGQTKPVTVYRLVCKDTVEERVLELQNKKRDLVREIFDDQSAPALKLDELMNLLR